MPLASAWAPEPDLPRQNRPGRGPSPHQSGRGSCCRAAVQVKLAATREKRPIAAGQAQIGVGLRLAYY